VHRCHCGSAQRHRERQQQLQHRRVSLVLRAFCERTEAMASRIAAANPCIALLAFTVCRQSAHASLALSLLGHTATLGSVAFDGSKVLRHLPTLLRISKQAAALACKRRVPRKSRRLYVFVVAE